MGVNSRYKDSVFSLLFSDPDTLCELYGAIERVELDPDVPITINTLEDALFMDRINDISFTIGNNEPILRRSKKLDGYSAFIDKARELDHALKDRDKAVKQAVR
jgi:hypothetical protein